MKPSLTKISVFLALLMAFSCTEKRELEEQIEDVVIVRGFIEAGEPIQDLSITGLDGTALNSNELLVSVTHTNGQFHLEPDAKKPGVFHGPSEHEVVPNSIYNLEIQRGENVIRGQTSTAPEMSRLTTSKEFIDVELAEDRVFLSWDDANTESIDEYFYYVTLVPTDLSPELIRGAESDSFKPQSIVSFVPELTLNGSDFAYFGNHLVRVSTISLEFLRQFQAQTDLSTHGPSNIIGAHGYFIGKSSVESLIEVR